MHCSANSLVSPPLSFFLLSWPAVQISRVTDSSRFTHHPHTPTLNARTPTRELHARSPARQALELRSAVVPARSPQPSEPAKAKRSSLRLHRDRNGSVRERNARKARQGRQSIPRTPQRGAGRAGQLARPNFHHSDVHSACVCVPLFASPTYCLLLLALRTTNSSHRSGACTCTTSSKRMAALAGALPRTCPRHPIVLRRCLVRLVMGAIRDCE